MAFAHELVRQGKRNLHIYTCNSEIDIDILAGARVASKFELAFFAIEGIRLHPNIQRRIKDGSVQIEDYTNLAMALRFLGGALSVPFMPIKSMLGTALALQLSSEEKVRAVIPTRRRVGVSPWVLVERQKLAVRGGYLASL